MLVRKPNKSRKTQTDTTPKLFVQQHNYKWFFQQIKQRFNGKLNVYSTISRSFTQTFLKERMFGRELADFTLWLGNNLPSVMGRWGQYPIFLLKKETKSLTLQ